MQPDQNKIDMMKINPRNEPEIVNEVFDIANPDGTFNTDARGWSRKPYIRENLKFWGRRKRFEYWAVWSDEVVFAFSVSHSDYRAGAAVFVLDRKACVGHSTGVAGWIPGVNDMPVGPHREPFGRYMKGLYIGIMPNDAGTELHVEGKGIKAKIQIHKKPDQESMAVIVPWTSRKFQYTRKGQGYRAEGSVEVNGKTWSLSPEDSWAALDVGRGIWPFHTKWNWGAGYGMTDGHEVGIQLGDKWTDGTPATENAIKIDGRIEKISHDVRWHYNPNNFMEPWKMEGRDVSLVFTPEYLRHADPTVIFPWSREDQAFGVWNGWIRSESAGVIEIKNLFGWAEELERYW